MIFLQPNALLLLVVVAIGVAVALRRRPWPPVMSRTVLLVLLVIALARPSLVVSQTAKTVVYLIDQSDSIPTAERERAAAEVARQTPLHGDDTTVHVRSFGATVWSGLEAGPGAHTLLAPALQHALQLIPTDHTGEIVVFTDGRIGDVSVDEALSIAQQRGIAIRTVALDPLRDAATPAAVQLPERATPGETITVDVVLNGGRSGHNGLVSIRHQGDVLVEQTIELAPRDSTELSLTVPLPPSLPSGLAALTVSLGSEEIVGHLLVDVPPVILLVGDRRGDMEPMAALLTAEGLQVQTVSPRDVPDDLDNVDVVILVDTPIRPSEAGGALLPLSFVETLTAFATDGGGVLVVGGERAYELGGWEGTALESILPVRIDPDGATKEDAVTMVIALDKSGSMARPAVPGELGGGLGGSVSAQLSGGRPAGSKIRLATEGVIAALGRLREADKMGVITIDSVARQAVAVQDVRDRTAIENQVSQIGAGGGGINLMAALEATYASLQDAPTPIRHAILFADASGISQRRRGDVTALALVERYRTADITLSIVGIGGPTSRDAEYLASLAAAGGGELYLTDDARELPALFTEETERLMGVGLEEDVAIVAQQAQWHPALRSVDIQQAPPLRGINTVKRRPRTRVLLTTQNDQPLLAIWRVGLGEVAAVSTDVGARWAAPWLRWDGHARLWTQMVRHLAAAPQGGDAALVVTPVPGGGRAQLTTRRPDGLSGEAVDLHFWLQAENDEPREVSAVVVEPGTWEVRWDSPPAVLWQLSVNDENQQTVIRTAWAAPPSGEGRWQQVDEQRLQQLQQSAQRQQRHRTRVDLIPWLLGLVIVLLPVDAFARNYRGTPRRRRR